LAFSKKFDQLLGEAISQSQRIPVMVNVLDGRSKSMRDTIPDDLELLERIAEFPLSDWVPVMRMPNGEESRRNDKFGITHVHHFFTRRNLITLSRLFALIRNMVIELRLPLLFMATSAFRVLTIRSLFLPNAYICGGTGPFKPSSSGTLYIPSLTGERNVILAWEERIKQFTYLFQAIPATNTPPICSAQSSGDLRQLLDSSVDYVFVDPPFGRNIMYSELNILWEAWLRVQTNPGPEAIENSVQHKDLIDYEHLMRKCFEEFYRILKPGRWMTVIFHNSSNAVWNALQTAVQQSGFVVADVSILDRKQGTFVQYTAAGSVKQDLVISAYKPNGGIEERFKLKVGTQENVWDFVRTHLRQLPTFLSREGRAQVIPERQNFLLFDRTVAFHVQRSVTVPLSAAEFYAGLVHRFSERDGMYFLPEQVAEYDKKRMTVREVLQLQLFVTDESSAIQWLKQQLIKKPQAFQELHPQFLKEIGGWQKHEEPLELSKLLAQSFLIYDGKGEVPNQIHSYISTNFKELRNLPKDDESLRAKGKDRWYVPDPNKAGDLEKLRERSLLKEFEEYRTSSQKRLKVFRLEAVRAGFKKAWQERDYATVITVASKIPENVLLEDPKLLMWYDQALTRTGEKT
jgi:16S rRNA G966 N2-methylase RsmD